MFMLVTDEEYEAIGKKCNELTCDDCLFSDAENCHFRDPNSIIYDEKNVVYVILRK